MEFDSFVLAASTADLDEEPAAREHADAVEFRMDLAEAPIDALETYDGELPIIATNRPTWEGGKREDGEGRAAELRDALAVPAVEAVDVELTALVDGEPAAVDLTDVVQTAAAGDVATIVSHHDFESTPDLSDLAGLAAQVCTVGDVGKLAVTAGDMGEVLDLLRVTHEFSAADRAIATMAMGAVGAHSRVVAPLYGSKIGYAPVDPEAATAPGQYDLATLADLIGRLR
jgi:3-dehydroquinate dehydratase-1